MKLLFATNNQHKIDEIQVAIGNIVEVTGLKQAGINIDILSPMIHLKKTLPKNQELFTP